MDLALGAALALWLGILTSISPCPLATNIAAVSYIGRRVDDPRLVIWSGLLYTLGRTTAYIVLGSLLVMSLISAPYLSQLLQKYVNIALGPLLILVGMFLLRLIQFNAGGSLVSEAIGERTGRMGIWGALVLGVVFAMSFCPVSAALFFGSLIPLAVRNESRLLLPLLYGIGTALPVVVFSIIIALGTRSVGNAFSRVTALARWAQKVTGAVFIAVGIYFCLVYIFHAGL